MGLSDIKKVCKLISQGLTLRNIGDNYVNVNSRDKKKREKGREKNNFEYYGIKKERQTKRCGKNRQQEIVRDINKSRSLIVYIKNFISKTLYQKVHIKNFYMEKFILKSLY